MPTHSISGWVSKKEAPDLGKEQHSVVATAVLIDRHGGYGEMHFTRGKTMVRNVVTEKGDGEKRVLVLLEEGWAFQLRYDAKIKYIYRRTW